MTNIDPTRRQFVALMGGTAATIIIPMDAARALPVSSSLGDLHSSVSRTAREFHASESATLLDGVYAKIFDRVPAQSVIESVVQVKFLPVHAAVIVDPPKNTGRFVWNFETKQDGAAFHAVRDNDPRTVIDGGRVVRHRDLSKALADLTRAMRRSREMEAANIFNSAQTYDVNLGGDGVSLCSLRHPHESGVWANTLLAPCDLNSTSLAAVLQRIESDFVDEAGIKIKTRGRSLLVARENASAAHQTLSDLDGNLFAYFNREPIVWNQLGPNNWFVLTETRGLTWFERDPFSITCIADAEKDCVLVFSDERRKFGCRDPRAVFGSIQTLNQGISHER